MDRPRIPPNVFDAARRRAETLRRLAMTGGHRPARTEAACRS